MESKVDQTQLERPYTFFLFKGIMGIYEAWDEGEKEVALARALRLVVFLPTDIKEKLWPRKKEITVAINAVYKINDATWFSTRLARNKAARRVANLHLEPFVDKMVRLLDEKQWLERGALRPRFLKERKLRVT